MNSPAEMGIARSIPNDKNTSYVQCVPMYESKFAVKLNAAANDNGNHGTESTVNNSDPVKYSRSNSGQMRNRFNKPIKVKKSDISPYEPYPIIRW